MGTLKNGKPLKRRSKGSMPSFPRTATSFGMSNGTPKGASYSAPPTSSTADSLRAGRRRYYTDGGTL